MTRLGLILAGLALALSGCGPADARPPRTPPGQVTKNCIAADGTIYAVVKYREPCPEPPVVEPEPAPEPLPEPTPEPAPAPEPEPTPAPAPAPDGTLVSTSAGLTAAITAARGGETILLAPGSYSALTIYARNFATPVTIRSADLGNRAKLPALTVNASSGLRIFDLELDAGGSTAYYPFSVLGSRDVRIERLWMHGSLDGNIANDIASLMVRNSSGVAITDSEFEQLAHGINFLDSERLLFERNRFHDLRIDGIRGGGSSYVTIRANRFSDFRPQEGDHPDAIQFWTTNTTVPAHDFTITDNLVVRGSGGIAQGIFVTEQVGLAYENVTIADNLLVGTMWNGIMVAGARNIAVTGNTIASGADMKSWVRLENVDGGTIANNRAGDFLRVNTANLAESGNAVAFPTAAEIEQLIREWEAAH